MQLGPPSPCRSSRSCFVVALRSETPFSVWVVRRRRALLIERLTRFIIRFSPAWHLLTNRPIETFRKSGKLSVELIDLCRDEEGEARRAGYCFTHHCGLDATLEISYTPLATRFECAGFLWRKHQMRVKSQIKAGDGRRF